MRQKEIIVWNFVVNEGIHMNALFALCVMIGRINVRRQTDRIGKREAEGYGYGKERNHIDNVEIRECIHRGIRVRGINA